MSSPILEGPAPAVRFDGETALVVRALMEHGDEVEALDATPWIRNLARRNDKRPATIELAAPDPVVLSLKGEPEQRGKLCLVWIPAVVLEDMARKVLLPAEAARADAAIVVAP